MRRKMINLAWRMLCCTSQIQAHISQAAMPIVYRWFTAKSLPGNSFGWYTESSSPLLEKARIQWLVEAGVQRHRPLALIWDNSKASIFLIFHSFPDVFSLEYSLTHSCTQIPSQHLFPEQPYLRHYSCCFKAFSKLSKDTKIKWTFQKQNFYTALLRINWHTINFTYFKCTI